MSIYPDNVADLSARPRHAEKPPKCNAEGVAAGFECGCFVRMYLEIDTVGKQVVDAGFHTNGCGFAVAAAEILAEKIVGRSLQDFRGHFESEALRDATSRFPHDRKHCSRISEDAITAALAGFRVARIAETRGGDLICSCFGVSERAIIATIEETFAESVDEVGAECRAGTGCGSCRLVIEQLLDDRRRAD